MWKVTVAFRKTFPDIKWELGKWPASDRTVGVCEVFESGTFTGPWAELIRRIAPTNRAYNSDAAIPFRFDEVPVDAPGEHDRPLFYCHAEGGSSG